MAKPGDSHSLPNLKPRDAFSELINPANDLMAGNHRSFVRREVAFDDMDVRPARRTSAHLYSYFVRRSLRFIDLAQNQRRFAHRFLLR